MKIKTAEFVISNTEVSKCPKEKFPEYAFIGRSNVGKSSLINMLTNHGSLAKTSGKPGKTQLINHFIINKNWFLVDLPGYGYASVSKDQRRTFQKFIQDYFNTRMQLACTFVLIDSRHKPQKIDLEFMEFLGVNAIPFCIVFTKSDKLNKSTLPKNIENYKKELLETWEELPPYFISSATNKAGQKEILDFIQNVNESLNQIEPVS
jgi:GTP-binding protein